MFVNQFYANNIITIITYVYPSYSQPTLCPFVKELVEKWKEIGCSVQVINPLTWSSYFMNMRGKKIDGVLHPLYLDYRFLKVTKATRKLQTMLADLSFERAVKRCIKKEDKRILYSHFLNAGYVASSIAKKFGWKNFCAFGESTLWSIKNKNMKTVKHRLKYIDGYISVSSENAKTLILNDFTTEGKVIVLPNGVDMKKFYPRDKAQCRKELNLSSNCIIGIFVGHFSERKGIMRVVEATRNIPGLGMIYIGSGEKLPKESNTMFCGKVEHDIIPIYLSAADFFILPTEAEGCCNAIIEAMACGLPIISSVGAFNDEILDESCSIRIDPGNVNDIRQAILSLILDEMFRGELSKGSVKKAVSFDIFSRAIGILDFIAKKSNELNNDIMI